MRKNKTKTLIVVPVVFVVPVTISSAEPVLVVVPGTAAQKA